MGSRCPALNVLWSSLQFHLPGSVCFKVTLFRELAPASPACSQNRGPPVINTALDEGQLAKLKLCQHPAPTAWAPQRARLAPTAVRATRPGGEGSATHEAGVLPGKLFIIVKS